MNALSFPGLFPSGLRQAVRPIPIPQTRRFQGSGGDTVSIGRNIPVLTPLFGGSQAEEVRLLSKSEIVDMNMMDNIAYFLVNIFGEDVNFWNFSSVMSFISHWKLLNWEIISNPLGHMTVFTNALDRVVATGMLKPEDQDTAWVLNVAVHEKYRRQGVGRAVMEDLISQARKKGYRTLLLNVTNPHAQALYEKVGFKVIKEERIIQKFIPEQPEVLKRTMHKEL